jgi:two-component system LytT family response regulator
VRVVIVDDEPLARARLARLLAAHADVEVAAELGDATVALAELPKLAPDVALLDIRMPQHDGFELAGVVPAHCHVIFVTAHADHAVRAFDEAATDYLVKPVDGARLARALDRVRDRLRANEAAPARLAVRDGSRFVFVALADVDAAIARGNYVELRAGGTAYMLRSTLTDVEARLDGAFVRIHRSVLVRAERITAIEPLFRGEYLVTLADGSSYTSARTHRAELRRALGLT